MAVPRIQDLSAYSMAQIQQSLNQYLQNSNKFGNERASNYRMPGYRDFLINQNARQGYKSGSGYGIEDEYRYMVGEKGFVGERAAGAADATTTETAAEETTKTDPVIDNPYSNGRIADLEAMVAARAHRFSTEFGQNAQKFGHEDYEAALKGGGSNTDIFNFLDKNQGLLGGGNVAGQAGGLYETLKIKAAEETAAKPDFGAQLAEMQRQQTAYLNDLQIQQNQRLDQMAAKQKAATEELALGQRTSLLNQARSGQMGALQIGGASETPRTGGTQGFKRRKLQINPVTANALSGILGGTSAATQTNVLNV